MKIKRIKLYKKHLASFVKGQGMLRSTKLSIIGSVTLLMAVGFFLMARKGIWIPCIILAVVWIAIFFTLDFVSKRFRKQTQNEIDERSYGDTSIKEG